MFQKNLHLMSGPEGSVEKLANALDEQMPAVVRSALADHERSARWAVLPQDSRIVAYGGLRADDPQNTKVVLRQERLEAAQNLSEARALLIARQLDIAAATAQE
jgi:hypothetical protein